MKNIFLTLLLIFTSINFVKSQVVISNDIYTVIYSEALQQPLMLSYEIENSMLLKFLSLNKNLRDVKNTSFSRTSIGLDKMMYRIGEETKVIKPDSCDYIHSINTSDNEDYLYNDFDKGHLAPYSTFKDRKIDCVLNDYLNIALMHSSLNSGVWSTLEKREKNLEKNIFVTISLSFDKSERVPGGATIPSGFTKILSYYSEGEFIEEIYSFPNNSSVLGKDLSEFKIN